MLTSICEISSLLPVWIFVKNWELILSQVSNSDLLHSSWSRRCNSWQNLLHLASKKCWNCCLVWKVYFIIKERVKIFMHIN